jgi:hypothetical protein
MRAESRESGAKRAGTYKIRGEYSREVNIRQQQREKIKI